MPIPPPAPPVKIPDYYVSTSGQACERATGRVVSGGEIVARFRELEGLLLQRAQEIAELKAELVDVAVIRKDASELLSSLGFILMRCAVAESGQDAYDVCQREFKEHEAALLRLEKMLPAYGSAEWHAMQRERINDATGMGRSHASAEVEEKVPDVQDAVGNRHRAVRGVGALLPDVPEDREALPDSAAARVAEDRAEKAEKTLGPVKRYQPMSMEDDGRLSYQGMLSTDGGEWVRFEDVEALLTARAQEIAQVQAVVVAMREWTRGDGDVFGRIGPTTRRIRSWADELEAALVSRAPQQEPD